MNKLSNLYRQVIMDHYKNPRNKGLKDNSRYVTHRIKNPTCGDDITVQSLIEEETVKDVRHEGTGCSICCSSASVMSETLIGKSKEEALSVTNTYLNLVTNKEYDESIELEDAIVYEGVKDLPARTKCATAAWLAFLSTTEESSD